MKNLKKTASVFFGGLLVGIIVISNHPTYLFLIAISIFIVLYTIVK
ncbi:hypothetical protein LCGC14_0762310 [marine sediment metagenome]|uniref:Uncharacterized protein n=1 Tax=marine sediment metagenome TaxID=412755 RepID=A0A0F9T7S5_9ZZZZ